MVIFKFEKILFKNAEYKWHHKHLPLKMSINILSYMLQIFFF